MTSQTALAIPAGPGGGGPHGPTDYRSDSEETGADIAEEAANRERIRRESLRPEDLHNENLEACGTDSDCLREEQQRYETEQRAASNEEAGETPADSTTVTEITENEADKERRLNSERVRTAEAYADNCYGYPGGDTQDSSDFALKVDCILKTSDQNLSFFTYGENEATVENGGKAPIEKVVIKVIDTLIKIIGSVAMLLIVIAGIMMITSPGNENQRSKATEILTSAIIALVVAFSSYIIVNAVVGLFF